MPAAEYNLSLVSKRTDLSPQLIRAWESRHQAVSPQRSANGRRIYSESDVQRLILLGRLTSSGFAIRNIARLTLEELRELGDRSGVSKEPQCHEFGTPSEFLRGAIEAVERLDSDSLSRILESADVSLGKPAFLEKVLAPMSVEVGQAWREGRMRVAQEHFATAHVRGYLGTFGNVPRGNANTPRIVVTTPQEQWHELGALLAAAAAHYHGWRVIYLGPSIPAEEIAGAAISSGASAVALSLVYPEDDPHLAGELIRLRRLLPKKIAILAGGRGAHAYAASLEKIKARHIRKLKDLYPELDALRRS